MVLILLRTEINLFNRLKNTKYKCKEQQFLNTRIIYEDIFKNTMPQLNCVKQTYGEKNCIPSKNNIPCFKISNV